MHREKIRFPVCFTAAIIEESYFKKASKSWYCEEMIRKGIAILKMLENYQKSGDDVGVNVCSNLIRTGIRNITQKNQLNFELDTHILSCNPKERWIEIQKDFFNMERKSTTLMLSDVLADYLQRVSVAVNVSPSLLIFMYIQISFSSWFFKSSRSDSNPDIEKMDEIISDIQDTSADFEINSSNELEIVLKKTTKTSGERVSTNNIRKSLMVQESNPTTRQTQSQSQGKRRRNPH